MKGNHADIQSSYDKTLDKMLEVMERPDDNRTTSNPNVVVEKTQSEMPEVMPPRLQIRELDEAPAVVVDYCKWGTGEVTKRIETIIKLEEPQEEDEPDADDEADAEANADEEEPDADEEADADEEEPDANEEAAEEAEEADAHEADANEANEAYAEEESMEVITIQGTRYFCGEHTKQVYVHLNDEEAGELVGVLKKGKIVPM
jgi:hypothetical protein